MDIGKLKAPYQITEIDPWLAPYGNDIELRMDRFKDKRRQLVGESASLKDFANGYLFFGFLTKYDFCGSVIDEITHYFSVLSRLLSAPIVAATPVSVVGTAREPLA